MKSSTHRTTAAVLAAGSLVLFASGPSRRTIGGATPNLVKPNLTKARRRSAQSAISTQARLVESYGKVPLSFEANRGQTDLRVKFLSRGSGYTLFLTGDEAVLALRKPEVRSQEPEAGSPKLETRNSKLETRVIFRYSRLPIRYSRVPIPQPRAPSPEPRQSCA
jgi:hypothetical protein